MTKIFKDDILLKSLEGVVVSAVSQVWPSGRVTELKLHDNTKTEEVEVILESDAPRIDAGEQIRVYYNNAHAQKHRYYGAAVEILDPHGEVKFRYLGQCCKIK